MRVAVVEYDPTWVDAFEKIRDSLLTALGSIPIVGIEHTGSTSVSGLYAKPIIDIDVIVEAESFIQAAAALSFNGYTYNPERWGDRMSFRYNKHKHDAGATTPTEDGDLRRAVYLNLPWGHSLQNHRTVKKVLIERADLRDEYSAVKLELAKEELRDIGHYGARKRGIISRLLDVGGYSESSFSDWQAAREVSLKQ